MSVRILEGDTLAVLPTLDAGSVQTCVTSPPYWGLRDYGHAGQLGLERTPEEYVARMVAVFREVKRVLRDDGTLWLNLGDSYTGSASTGGAGKETAYTGARRLAPIFGANLKPKDLVGIPWRVAFALQADGWYLRSDIIWSKPNPMPESVTDRPTKAHEYVFLLAKSASYYYDAEAIAEEANYGRPSKALHRDLISTNGNGGLAGRDCTGSRNARSVWSIATQPYRGAHFATMPPALAEKCILAGSAKQACEVCGAAWERTTEYGRVLSTGGSDKGARATNMASVSPLGQDPTKGAYNTGNMVQREKITTGWQPRCTCEGATGSGRSLVLDPFGGAGTTGLVADRLGRDAVLIELNPEYATLARQRILGDNPLFGDVA